MSFHSLLKAVRSGELFGMMEVDIHVPDHLKDYSPKEFNDKQQKPMKELRKETAKMRRYIEALGFEYEEI